MEERQSESRRCAPFLLFLVFVEQHFDFILVSSSLASEAAAAAAADADDMR